MRAADRVRAAYRRIAETNRPEIWIDLRPEAQALADASDIDTRLAAGEDLPLAGTVLAVKGNIDVAGLPTTAGCPSYAYHPETDAPSVARLRAAGTVVLGTTNLDQFATGLVGTRSPYGAVAAASDPDRISGGSSAGSAVAVALGIADLALGTDTAGSGRVPAAFNGLVGLKPTRGLVPTRGVVPACRTLDCVTVFARTLPEAAAALEAMTGPDPADPLSRTAPPAAATPTRPRVGVPPVASLGELAPGWPEAFEAAADQLRTAGAELVPVDPAPFLRAGELLYEGAFVAERYSAVGAFIDAHQGSPGLDPTVAGIITRARDLPAHALFTDLAELDALRAEAARAFTHFDALLLPTTTDHPTLADVAADPVGVNTRLGRFTNCANLLDLCALSVPAEAAGERPFGAMLLGPAFTDTTLRDIAQLLAPRPRIAVVGAHLTGEPLNTELTTRGGRLTATAKTSPDYRLYALPLTPPRPGLVRVATDGAPIETEVWELPPASFADFITTAVPAPLTIGKITLADGTSVPGFLCEPIALHDATDITSTGGWRAYRATTR